MYPYSNPPHSTLLSNLPNPSSPTTLDLTQPDRHDFSTYLGHNLLSSPTSRSLMLSLYPQKLNLPLQITSLGQCLVWCEPMYLLEYSQSVQWSSFPARLEVSMWSRIPPTFTLKEWRHYNVCSQNTSLAAVSSAFWSLRYQTTDRLVTVPLHS